MNVINKLSIIGDAPFNKNHKIYLLKNNKVTPCYVKRIDDGRIEVNTTEETFRYPAQNLAKLTDDDKVLLFDIMNEISTSSFIITDEIRLILLDIEHIVMEVSKYFEFTIDHMFHKTRKREVVQARQIAMYFSKKYTKYSLAIIGYRVGKKDHATVLHADKTVKNLIETDKMFANYVNDIDKVIRKNYKLPVDN